jgi:flagellin-like hook-associated protein FlgL
LIEASVNGSQYDGVAVQMVDDELLGAGAGLVAGGEHAEFDPAARAARASLKFGGAGNDLTLTAATAGVAYNNVRIVIAGQTGLGNAANASYDAGAKRLTITVDDAGATTIDQVVNAINAQGTFTAAADGSGGEVYNPAATVAAADIGSLQGDTGNSGGAAKTLYVYVEAGVSNANQVAAAINAQGAFTAELDRVDTIVLAQAGTAPVSITATATTSGGAGDTLDLASGLKVTNGGITQTLDFSAATTVQEFLNVFNARETGLHAELSADGTRINVRSRLSGGDYQIGENGGRLATQLGIRTFTGETRLEDLNHGVGVPTKFDSFLAIPSPPPPSYPDFTIVADDGAGGTVDLVVDMHGAATVQDVLDLVNNHALNNTGGVAIEARLSDDGGGIEIVDTAGRPITIQAAVGSPAAEYLGLVPAGATSATSASGVLAGSDRNHLETASVFNTLIRLRDALSANDVARMERAIDDIDVDLGRVTFVRSAVGAQQQSLDVSQSNLEDEDLQLRTALGDEIEVDIVEAISNLTARQLSLQASLQAMGSMLQTTLLNYL